MQFYDENISNSEFCGAVREGVVKCEIEISRGSSDINDEIDNKERVWKRRILMEYIEGHGNIIMFYDSYRCGFCYYSDLSSVPYSALVIVAYKYAFTYKCISYLNLENNIEESKSHTSLPAKKTNVYQINSLEENMRSNTNVSEKVDNKKACVKIIRMGKICDFLFLGKPKSTTENSNIAVKQICYKDFMSQKLVKN